MPRSFVRLRFPASSHDENLQSIMHLHDPLGLLEDDAGWECWFDRAAWDAGLEDRLRSSCAEAGLHPAFDIERVEDENWNATWEAGIQPVHVSDTMVITPSWQDPGTPPGVLRLVIDPKMSFGTGFHATTRLMLRLLEQLPLQGTRVLDVGTGTGVLLIAAMKRGAAEGLGVDIDEWSLENATENLARNGITAGADIRQGSVEHATGSYHLILSNITRNDNIALLDTYARLLTADGTLLLSGFLDTDLADMRDALAAHGFLPAAPLQEDEWVALAATRE